MTKVLKEEQLMAIKIALAGNPNCGKTTMFNDLTGSNQYVGNWPGVTVEKKEGRLKGANDIIIQDLPGIYSLSPYTLEEVVARGYLVNEKPDAILNIVDATNIERNLYLTTQLTELGIPMVIALNMIDVARKNGDKIDLKKLGAALGCQVVETSALKGEGSVNAAKLAAEAAKNGTRSDEPHVFQGSVEHALAHIEDLITHNDGEEAEHHHHADGSTHAGSIVAPNLARWYAIKLFERDEKAVAELNLPQGIKDAIERTIKDCENEMDDDSESIITNQRYAYINKLIATCVKKGRPKGALTTSDKIDRVITNRWAALPIFVAVMWFVYYISVTTIGTIVTDFTNDVFVAEWIQTPVMDWLSSIGTADWLVGLIGDGIIGGVGAVLGFVPQMLVLFFMLAILEDVGYMSRIAFIMDRIFRKFGLSGKSFIPMLIGSGCGVPGIMASRTIENDRDRKMTIMTTTFIPCGAKLPIIALLMGALVGDAEATWIAPLFYFLGVVAVIVSGIMLKKTKLFAGRPTPFVMELPSYHFPSLKSWWLHIWERVSAYVKKAFTIIFASTIVVWFLSNFGVASWDGGTGAFGFLPAMEGVPEEFTDYSVLAMLGGAIAWIFAPLGFSTWQATAMSITGLVAKENVIATAASLLHIADAGETDPALWQAFAAMFPSAGAIAAFGAFNLLCAPCFAAMGTIRAQMNSGKWTAIALGYECAFAWVVGLIINQLYNLIVLGEFGLWTVVAFAFIALILFQLFRPMPKGAMGEDDGVAPAAAAA